MRDLPEGWVEKELGEVADIIDGDRGKNYPNGQDFSADGYCLFLNTKNIPNTTFSFSEKIFITKEKDASLRKGKLKRGDFVLTTRGTIGNYAYFSDDIPYDNIRINSGMVLLRTTVVKGFFYYYLGSNLFKHQVVSLQSGSAQPQLPIKDLKMFVVNLPPLPEQKAIADMLSSFDEKIELLREQNKTLETLAQTIFKEWFVHFNFPDQHGNPYRNNGGAMVESELGLIPKSWRVGKLGDVVKTNVSSINKNSSLDVIQYLDTGSLTEGHVESTQELHLADAPSRARRIVQHNDVLISTVRPNLKHYGIIKEPDEHLIVSTGFCVITCDGINPHFVYYLLTTNEMTDYLHSVAEGSTSTYPSIKPSDIEKVEFVLPPESLLKLFSDYADKAWDKIMFNQKQIQTLSKTRDTLLPKLMSGHVRVGGKAS